MTPGRDSTDCAARLRLRNDRDEHQRLQGALRRFCAENGIGDDCAHQLRLLLEEMFINAATHAYSEGVSGWIDVTFGCRDSTVSIVIEDEGTPFNPLERPAPDLSVEFDEREIGGHGLLLIRSLADDVDYAYCGKRNQLRVICRAS